MTRAPSLLAAAVLLALAGCGDGDQAAGPGGPGGRAPSVVGARVESQAFSDSIEAVGTAYANEQTVLTSPVTERIESLFFNDGAVVSRGAVIARLSRGEESADLAAVEARARQAQQQLGRLQELQERGFATRAALEEQTAARDAARADASAIQSRISDRVIRAPFSGVLSLRTISPGAIVNAGSPIATISDVSSIKLDFTLPEQFLSVIEKGQNIEAHAAAYPNETFRGEIDNIDAVVDPLSRSVTVRAQLPNPDRRLRPGMLLTVEIVSDARTSLSVPETALVSSGEDTYVFIVDDDGVARRTRIEIGARQDGRVEVLGGLDAGDRFVADGTVKVRDDMPVAAKFPDAPQAAPARRPVQGGGPAGAAK